MASNPENESTASSEVENPPIEPFRLPTVKEMRGQDIWNNCAVRNVVSGVMGGGLGLMMGLLLGALDTPIMQDEMTGKQQIHSPSKVDGPEELEFCKSICSYGIGFLSCRVCCEKARVKHDTTNTVVAGYVTGGALSAKAGPQSACVGCAGFAAFLVLIEKFLDRHD